MPKDWKLALPIILIIAMSLAFAAGCGDGNDDSEDATATIDVTADPTKDGPDGTPADDRTPADDSTPGQPAAGPTSTPGPPPEPAVVATPGSSAQGPVLAAVAEALVAMQGEDGEALLTLMDERTRGSLEEGELDELLACLAQHYFAEPATGEVDINDDRARVQIVFLRLDDEGTPMPFERLWEFERQDDGGWLLYRVPNCPRLP